MEKYRSLQDIYLKESFAKSLPPLPRQTINWLMEAIADAPPPAPNSAYVQLYVKDPSKNEQQFVGNIDIDYFNKVVKPVLNRGSEGAINVNKLIEKRLKDANITTENLNIIFDYIQNTGIKISSENFAKCQSILKTAIASETPFNITTVLSESFDTPVESISNKSNELLGLMRLKAQSGSATFEDRSQVAGPGEVVLSFFGNGRKLITSKKKTEAATAEKGDISLGELRIELKGTQGRIYPATKITYSQHGTPGDFAKKNLQNNPLDVVKYYTFGEEGLSIDRFDNEINAGLKQNIDVRLLATGLALREYQVKSGFHYYGFVDSKTFNCVALTSADKDIIAIGKFYTSYIGNYLSFDRGGHKLPPAFKI